VAKGFLLVEREAELLMPDLAARALMVVIPLPTTTIALV
jgi:hypothetical protein